MRNMAGFEKQGWHLSDSSQSVRDEYGTNTHQPNNDKAFLEKQDEKEGISQI